jgi:hypothetical protein
MGRYCKSNNVLKIWNGTQWTIAQDSESAKTIANLKNRTFMQQN